MRGLVWQCAAALSAWTLYCAAGLRACGRHDRRRTDPRDAPCKLCARERASAGTVTLRRQENPPRRHGDTEKSNGRLFWKRRSWQHFLKLNIVEKHEIGFHGQ